MWQEVLRQALPRLAKVVNGWQMNIDTMGVYGNFYVKRAVVAMIGLGANATEDAVYPVLMADAEGFQAANSINRFAIGDRDRLQYNADGSLDLYLQHQSPGQIRRPTGCPPPKARWASRCGSTPRSPPCSTAPGRHQRYSKASRASLGLG